MKKGNAVLDIARERWKNKEIRRCALVNFSFGRAAIIRR